jgi:hypothetical protein
VFWGLNILAGRKYKRSGKQPAVFLLIEASEALLVNKAAK